jgi:hypothetical protein
MHQAQIFLSYRRDDAAGYARAIEGELVQRFGAGRVFMDVDDIGAGQGYAEAIERAVGGATVLLVLIGRHWHGPREGQPSRLNEPGDFVRREVAAALARGMRVIPLLLDGAAMPTEAELPAELRPLAGHQALEISNARFADDIERLDAALQDALGQPARLARGRLMRRWALIGAGLLAATLASAWLLRAASPARPAFNGEWQAEVDYDWPNAHYVERFSFSGKGGDVHGSAGFLGVPRGVLQGQVKAGRLSFSTRTTEQDGGEMVHRYGGHLVGDEIHFTMQTEGGTTPHVPVEFIARRVAP